VAELAAEISAEYEGRKVLLVCVLKGAVVFASDLMRRLKIPVEIDFIAVSSYGSGHRFFRRCPDIKRPG